MTLWYWFIAGVGFTFGAVAVLLLCSVFDKAFSLYLRAPEEAFRRAMKAPPRK